MRSMFARLMRSRGFRRSAAGAGLLAAAGALAILLWPMDTAPYLSGVSSPQLLDRHGAPLAIYLNEREEWRLDVPLDRISPNLLQATVAAEDQRFWQHPGIDLRAVARAVIQNLEGCSVLSGASTITMQVVKMASPPKRSLAAKAGQALQAVRLEARTGKAKILQAYLNGVNYGGNLVGCEAAGPPLFRTNPAEN